ncbi:unnamed protein product (macronuclear) [Paramecium tetraurelia]|uniref:GYF domain-containing protein n=1 Tax=Paramecium tetraurelia TaxID=5888 RepID=A0DK57_PARTE|nr:uncharacterized protein GSPATT00017753001 [Paramecium tetraurelia]CAK83424.1 unnamed protein product [Paramecium tetraurelia]|eukprot:XP_001450821.1 hypothetical protein (macronuclear) [Paramecium tetraurelia strain d4-2]
MSKQQQQQLSYICKDQQNQKGQGQSHRRMNTNQNNFDDKNVQNQKKQNKYNRRSNSQEKQQNSHNQPSQPVLARAQINQPQNKIYDSHSLILAYQELLEPPQELEEFIGKIPHLFTKISQKPLISPSTQFTHSDEDDPKWMHSNETFQIIDIENEIEKKRIEYQKSHGTFEKKQEQKSKKQNEINQEEISELQQAKEKYRQLREQEEKQLQVASETKAKLQELFSFSEQEQPKLNNSINTKVLSVEEVEKQALAFSNNKQKDLIKVEQPQEKIESYFSNFNNNQTDDFFEQLEEMGIHIQRQTQVPSQPTIKISREKIKTAPFSLQAQLHSRSIKESLWYYVDNSGKIQGGFTTEHMDQWFEHKYLKAKLNISWETPGKWITLEQYLINLDQIEKKLLDPKSAMDPLTLKTNINNIQLNNLQQLQQMNAFNVNSFQNQQMNAYQYQQVNHNQYQKYQNQQMNNQQNNVNKKKYNNSNNNNNGRVQQQYNKYEYQQNNQSLY